MQNLFGDLRYTLRQLRLAPVFTLTAILTLALGIGGTTGMFSLIHAVMLRSLPVVDPGSLYRIGDGNDCCVEGGPQDNWGMFSYPLVERLRTSSPEFEQITAFQAGGWQFSVRRSGVDLLAKPLRGEYVTGNYFDVFGIKPFAGRLLTRADDQAPAAPAAVLSYRAWQGQYAGDPTVIGSTFIIEDHPFTVVGISPPGFFGETLRGDPPDFWMPLQQEPLIAGHGSLLRQSVSAWLRVIGRLKPGASVNGMSARLTGVLRDWIQNESGYPAVWMPEIKRALPKQIIHVIPAGSGVAEMKEEYGRSLQILLCVCALVLLIACANVANLMLARGMARRTQTSIRLAIGASRRRIILQSLSESVALSLVGGLAGLAVASGAAQLMLRLAFHDAKSLPIDTSLSLALLGFAFGLSLLTGILFGAAPAWFATKADPVEALRGANRSTREGSSLSRKALLALQATLSVVLIAGASMLTRSLTNLEGQNFGFQVKNRVLVNLNSAPATYSLERLSTLYRNLEERLIHMPGVEQAGLAMYNPLTDNWGELIFVKGHENATGINENSNSSWDRISPGYFRALGQTLARGRSFTEHDGDGGAGVAIVNQEFVRRFFPHEDPIDQHFGIDLPENSGKFRVVGVVRDAKYTQPGSPVRPMFFVPLRQVVSYDNPLLAKLELRSHFIGGVLLVTPTPPGTLEPSLRKVFAAVDPNLTILNVRTLQQQVDLQFDQQRAVASLAGLFGLIALLLAAVGLYGVTAYTVAQRTSEIGVRIALGAGTRTVIRLVLAGAFQTVIIGLLLGIPLAIGAGRLVSAQLYGIKGWDFPALAIAVAMLAVSALLAALIPAARAASIDPMKALRTE
ncbi:MAG: ABC transporter permease [Acidobacteriaceae bacterium]|nr:ABC transporter permease [Acidobacteriaceae bacterium]MBV8571259.1 ABC transporter permease [Acidobacteriaceae bacterium]